MGIVSKYYRDSSNQLAIEWKIVVFLWEKKNNKMGRTKRIIACKDYDETITRSLQLTHNPGKIKEGSVASLEAFSYFPDKSVHLIFRH